MDDRTTDKHETYGMLQISRVQTSKEQNLFGSSISHSNFITLGIYEGYVDRHLNKDWYHSKSIPIIEVEMSYSQFAEAITSLNQGCGTPVTIRMVNGNYTEPCPHTNKRKQFEAEFEKDMRRLERDLAKLTADAEKILNDKKLPSKTERQQILDAIQSLRQQIRSNIPFVASSFNEQMDKTVLEAKGEIEGFKTHMIISAGIEAIKEKQLTIEQEPQKIVKKIKKGE